LTVLKVDQTFYTLITSALIRLSLKKKAAINGRLYYTHSLIEVGIAFNCASVTMIKLNELQHHNRTIPPLTFQPFGRRKGRNISESIYKRFDSYKFENF
jgi:hypothetical protein